VPGADGSHASVTFVSVTDTARSPVGACGATRDDDVLTDAAAERRPRVSTPRADRRWGVSGLTATVARVPRSPRTVAPSR
jgi:hypothetical protein